MLNENIKTIRKSKGLDVYKRQGKIKTASTMVCVCLMLLPIPAILNTICVVVILVTTIWSGIEYFIKNRSVFSGAM